MYFMKKLKPYAFLYTDYKKFTQINIKETFTENVVVDKGNNHIFGDLVVSDDGFTNEVIFGKDFGIQIIIITVLSILFTLF